MRIPRGDIQKEGVGSLEFFALSPMMISFGYSNIETVMLGQVCILDYYVPKSHTNSHKGAPTP
jgi:hypothetical protein